MNFIFVSPNFPTNYWHFCDHLARNGVTVLGIGDCPYDQLQPELKGALTEYYRVGTMENYDEMYKAVAYFAFKYGQIDWLESNNEYWLRHDAALRTAFHITTGFGSEQRLAHSADYPKGHPYILDVKQKSAMKRFYAAAGIPACDYVLSTDGIEAAKALAAKVGYPLFRKPNIGVGACDAEKIVDEAALESFFAEMAGTEEFIIEPYITGDIWTYDAIIDAEGNPIFENNCICPPSIADIVLYNLDSTYYAAATVNDQLRDCGRRLIKAYGLKSRFVHCEFFRLTCDHPGLGKKGDFVGLEVNMRPGGGFTPDMINYAHDVDVYKVWADMICGATAETYALPATNNYFTMFAGVRDNVAYCHSHSDIMARYADHICMAPRMADALAPAMGNQAYIARFPSYEEMEDFRLYATERR